MADQPSYEDLKAQLMADIKADLTPKEEPKTYDEFFQRFAGDFAKTFGVSPKPTEGAPKGEGTSNGDEAPEPSHPFLKSLFGKGE